MIDSRLIAAVRAQLAERRRVLDQGARHVGWKLGRGERESIGGHIAVGYLTTNSVLEPGATFTAEPGAELHVDAEASVELSGPEEIGAYGVALEIVDLAPLPGEPESVVANNIFHRAASFGRFGPELAGAAVSLRVNGAERAAGRWPNDLHERIVALGEILEAAGGELRRGDRIITGSIVQVPIAAGDRVSAVTGDNVVVALDIA